MKTAICMVLVNLLIGGALIRVAAAQPALDELENQLDRILSGRNKDLPPPPEPEQPVDTQRGYLGLTADDSETRGGVEIIAVERGGPADIGGLTAGDLVLMLNRKPIRALDDVADALAPLAAGDQAEFEVFRSGRRGTYSVTLGLRPSGDDVYEVPPAETLPAPVPRADERRASLGVRVLPLTDDARSRYGLTTRRGAMISTVQEGWPADIAGLRVGDVIVSCDDQRVDEPDDLIGYLRTVRADQAIDLTFYRRDRLYRTTANLGEVAEAPPAATTPEPPLRLGESRIFGEDRPALRRIEGVIGRLASPDRETQAENAALQREVDLLRQQVKFLEQKVNELEVRLATEKP